MFEVLRKILIEKLGLEADLIRRGAFLEKDLELDSTETVVIAIEFKKLLNIDYEFPEQDMTLDDLCKQVDNLRS